LLPPFSQVRRRDALLLDIPARMALPEHDQTIRLRVRQRAQQHAIDYCKDRGIRADRERERERGHGGEARMLAEHPGAIAQVLPKGLHEGASVGGELQPDLGSGPRMRRGEERISSIIFRHGSAISLRSRARRRWLELCQTK
jgi:hypothetical protein